MPEKRERPQRAIIRGKASRLLKTARAVCNGATGIAMGIWDGDGAGTGTGTGGDCREAEAGHGGQHIGSSAPPARTASTSVANPEDGHALHRAVRGGNIHLVAGLLARGAPVDAKRDSGATPIHVAVKLGYEKIVALLLRRGADKDGLDGKGRTPLHLAAIYGQLRPAEVLLAAGADVSVVVVTSGYEHWALGFAARMGHISVLKLLVRHGADVNAVSSRGLTALHYAAVRNQAAAIVALAEAGANIEATVDEDGGGGTTLHAAAVMRCYEAALALLKLGANLEARNAFGYSPLHGAARQGGKEGAVEMVDLLLRWGADETVVDRDGNRAMDLVGSSLAEDDESRREDELVRLRKLLENAPADRAWRRRGVLALCRAFPDRALLSPDTVVADGAAAATTATAASASLTTVTSGFGSETGEESGSAWGSTAQQGGWDTAGGRRKLVATEKAVKAAGAATTAKKIPVKSPVTCNPATEKRGTEGGAADEFRRVLVTLLGLAEDGLFRDTVLFL